MLTGDIRNILADQVLSDAFMVMNHNVCPHATTTVILYLEAFGIEDLDWPSMTTDVNPVEHEWNFLKLRI